MSISNTQLIPTLCAGEALNQRIGLFVDTQNLYYSAKDYFSAHLHYGRLLQCALRERQLQQANAYLVARDNPAHGFISKLSSFGYRLHLRQVAVHHSDEGRIKLEGDWDMGIAMDIVRALPYIDVVVLASGDGDFVPLLRFCHERGLRTEVMAFRESSSLDLIYSADRFINLSELEGIFV